MTSIRPEPPLPRGIETIRERVSSWPRALVSRGAPAPESAILALQAAAGVPLPPDYIALQRLYGGLDLRGERILDPSESLDALTEAREAGLPILPIATDQDGNLKCYALDDPELPVVDFDSQTHMTVPWFRTISTFVLTSLDLLAQRFDTKGRPRRLGRAQDGASQERVAIEIHLQYEPQSAYGLLELANWHRRYASPELTIRAYRDAADRSRTREQDARLHLRHALYAVEIGRFKEARRALRKTIAVETHAATACLPVADLAAGRRLLAELYDHIGQTRRGVEQRRLATEVIRSSPLAGDLVDPDLERAASRVREAAPPVVSLGQRADARAARVSREPELAGGKSLDTQDEPEGPSRRSAFLDLDEDDAWNLDDTPTPEDP